jgi:hypothetical protein
VWTVPFGGGAGRIMRLGFQPVNYLGAILWKRGASAGCVALGHAASDCSALSEKSDRVAASSRPILPALVGQQIGSCTNDELSPSIEFRSNVETDLLG